MFFRALSAKKVAGESDSKSRRAGTISTPVCKKVGFFGEGADTNIYALDASEVTFHFAKSYAILSSADANNP